MPKVTAIIPTYERSNILRETLDSVLNQNYEDWDVIVVDDNDEEDYRNKVREIVEDLDEEYDNDFRYILNDDGNGPASARNKGIENAEGDYIAFLDDDDRWKPKKLEKQMEALKSSEGFDASHTSREMDTPENHPPHVVEVEDVTSVGQVLARNPIATSSVVVKKESLDEVGGFEEDRNGGEDWHLWTKLTDDGCKFKAVEAPLTIINLEVESYSSESETSTPGKDRLGNEYRDVLKSDSDVAFEYYLARGKEHLKFKNFDKSETFLRRALAQKKLGYQPYIFLFSNKLERTTGNNPIDFLVKIKHRFD
jgi:glycosyltransferase involved in cell wall biosynthesis